MRHCRVGRFGCGQCIIAEGALATDVMVLLNGHVNVVRSTVSDGGGDCIHQGRWASDVDDDEASHVETMLNGLQLSRWVGELNSDDVFGEGALLEGDVYRDASIVATCQSVVMSFPAIAFEFDDDVTRRIRKAVMTGARMRRAQSVSPTNRLCERLKNADPQTLHSIILQTPRIVIGLEPTSHHPDVGHSGQVLTDLQREPGVVLDDLTVPTNTDAASKQFFRRVSAAVAEIRRNGGVENAHDGTSEASILATSLLSMCSRTTAGGDAYNAVAALFPTQIVCSRQPSPCEIDDVATSFRFHSNCIECRSVNLFGLIRADVETEQRRWIDIIATVYTYIIVLNGMTNVFRRLECTHAISKHWVT